MTRDEHLQWCKDRALEYVDAGDLKNAVISMASDIQKHEETASHVGVALLITLFALGHLNTQVQMRHYIEGFN